MEMSGTPAMMVLAQYDLLTGSDLSLEDPANAQSSDVFIISQIADLHLKRFVIQIRIWIYISDDGLKQWNNAVVFIILMILDYTVLGDAV